MVLEPRVYKGTEQSVAVSPKTNVGVTVARGNTSKLRVSTSLNEPLIAPLSAGQRVGELTVMDGDTVVRRVPLVVSREVPAGGIWAQTRDTVSLWFR
jgi:D-alanyl-D-alanine carboxypeptidase (penicillin-binding protein 5/6)